MLKVDSEKWEVPVSAFNERAKASPVPGLADFITRTCSSVLKKVMIWLNGPESLKEGSFKDRAKIFEALKKIKHLLAVWDKTISES